MNVDLINITYWYDFLHVGFAFVIYRSICGKKFIHGRMDLTTQVGE